MPHKKCYAQFERTVTNQSYYLLHRLKEHHLPTFQHSCRVGEYCFLMAMHAGILGEKRDLFVRSALLHDIGKLRVPASVLNKKETLSGGEWAMVRNHCQAGLDLLSSLRHHNQIDCDVILYHHENLDGSGYPYARQGTALSATVRMIRVADSYDAMTTNRSYNRPKSSEQALEELAALCGKQYDAEAVALLKASLAGRDSLQAIH